MDVPESAVRVPFRPLSQSLRFAASNLSARACLLAAATAESVYLKSSGTAALTIAPSRSFCVFYGFMGWAVVVGISYMALNPALTVFHFFVWFGRQ